MTGQRASSEANGAADEESLPNWAANSQRDYGQTPNSDGTRSLWNAGLVESWGWDHLHVSNIMEAGMTVWSYHWAENGRKRNLRDCTRVKQCQHSWAAFGIVFWPDKVLPVFCCITKHSSALVICSGLFDSQMFITSHACHQYSFSSVYQQHSFKL